MPLRTLLDAFPDMVWICAAKSGEIMEVNAAAVARLGYSRKELIGRPVSDFYFDLKDRRFGEAFAQRALKDGSTFLTVTMRDKKGAPLEIEIHGAATELEGKKAVLSTARAIGEGDKEKRRAITLYEAFKRSNDVMFYCDRNGVILDVNEAFTRHYGYQPSEVLGQTPRILRSQHSSQELYSRMWSQITGRGYWRGQIVNRAKDGREIPLILTITAVKDASGEILGYVSNAVDISEQVALQARVADSEALASVGEMAAVVAHEIRNPLGSIVMAAKQLVEGSLTPDDRQMVLRVLRAESQRLNEALTNFLSYARPRQVAPRPSDLNALVSEICKMIESNPELLGAIKIVLTLEKALVPFAFDPDHVRQVVWNIVLNAIQAVKGKGTIAIVTRREASWAVLEVRDSGPGIPADKRAAIFKPFHTSKPQGTGLGLAVAERIMKAHGGGIDVDDAKPGAIFKVRLPYITE